MMQGKFNFRKNLNPGLLQAFQNDGYWHVSKSQQNVGRWHIRFRIKTIPYGTTLQVKVLTHDTHHGKEEITIVDLLQIHG